MDTPRENLEKLVAACEQQFLTLEYQLAQFDTQHAPADLVQQIEAKRAELISLKKALAAKEKPVAVGVEQHEVSPMNREIQEITDPLLKRNVLNSVDALIRVSLKQVMAEAGPRQGEVLRRCAIPRWFDRDILAVLREREDGNERVLEHLSRYSFVHQVGEGRYAYHGEVRETFLREWHEQRELDFQNINLKLASYFKHHADETMSYVPKLSNGSQAVTVSGVPKSNSEMYAREALFHTMIADPQLAMEQFLTLFEKEEAAHRLADAEALLQITREIQLDEHSQRWVLYLRARLDYAALCLNEARQSLEDILEEPNLDSQLRAKAEQTLGEVLAETGQWVQAIDLYLKSHDYFRIHNLAYDEAKVMLLLGRAYQDMGASTGHWRMPHYVENPFGRLLGQVWYRIISIPFVILVFFLRRTSWSLPQPAYLALYQNWLLVWMYRSALSWYDRARDMLRRLDDDVGILESEQHIAEILLIFGHTDDAQALLNELSIRPVAADPYRRAWIESIRAMVLLDRGDVDESQLLLTTALTHFREVGDVRREAVVLALQSQAAEVAGQIDVALDGYHTSLIRYRALRYISARELVLHNLREWQQRAGSEQIADRIGGIIDAEPEKRYVARFPRSRLLLLRAFVILMLPLTLFAIFSPLLLPILRSSTSVLGSSRVGQLLPTSLDWFYNPWYTLAFLGVLILLYSCAYALVALAVVSFIPTIGALEREQPDYFVTSAKGIGRYDFRGRLAQWVRWDEIVRVVNTDRKLWQRPFLLFSSLFIETRDGRDMEIDGITTWYTSLQKDIQHHLAQSGSRAKHEDLSSTFVRSKSGVFFITGLLLLFMLLWAENSPTNWLIQILPASVYTMFSILILSNILIFIPLANWFARQPLSIIRVLCLPSRWPYVTGTIGLVAIIPYLLSGGQFFSIDELNVGMLLWGTYLLADSLYTLITLRK